MDRKNVCTKPALEPGQVHSNHTGHSVDTAHRIAPDHRSLVGIYLLPALLRQVAHWVLHPLGWFSCINTSKTRKSLSALQLGLLPAIKPLTLAGCYLGSAAGFEPATHSLLV